jgi:hypothetical protein
MLVVADIGMADCAPGAEKGLQIEASGVPLCTAAAPDRPLEFSLSGQTLGIALPMRATARCRLQKRLCSIYEQRDFAMCGCDRLA